MNIAGVEIGGKNPCRIVAEISNAHNGSLDRAARLIQAAQEAGADLVKFQCFTPDELVALRGDGPAPEPWGAQGWTMRTLYDKAETPHAWFPLLVAECEYIGIPWFSSVFGAESLKLLESQGCPAYKIARMDNATAFVKSVRKTRKPLIISANKGPGKFGKACVLYCPPGYPPTPDAITLPVFGEMVEWVESGDDPVYSGYTGLSCHSTDPRIPVAAVARGAKLLEYHVQLDDEPSELEADVSLTMTEFRLMVEDVRDTEAMLA